MSGARLLTRELLKNRDGALRSAELRSEHWCSGCVESQRLSCARESTPCLPGYRRALEHVEHTWQKADLPLSKVMKQRCELIVPFRTELPKAGRGTCCRSLVGGVRSGEGASRSWCCT